MTLALHGAPVFVFHEIVHRDHVVQALPGRAAVFVDRIARVPLQAVVHLNARGVANSVVAKARSR